LGEEMWHLFGKKESIFKNPVWFEVDKDALTVDETLIVVQINGKVRAKLTLPVGLSQEEVKEKVFADPKVKNYTEGKNIVKEIYVPNKIYNIVVK